MEKEAQIIEVEVVEIDGIVPVPAARAEQNDRRESGNDRQNWQGRVRQLDARWWPLWVLLGILTFVLLLTVGVVAGAIYIIYQIIRSILLVLVSAFKS